MPACTSWPIEGRRHAEENQGPATCWTLIRTCDIWRWLKLTFGGGQRIVQMQALISQGRSLGIDVGSAERVLGAMEDALAVMAEHRESIAAKIDAMHRGLM